MLMVTNADQYSLPHSDSADTESMAPRDPPAGGEENITSPLLSSRSLASADLENGDTHPCGLLNGCTDETVAGHGYEPEAPSLADMYGMGAMPSSHPLSGGESVGAAREKFESLDYE